MRWALMLLCFVPRVVAETEAEANAKKAQAVRLLRQQGAGPSAFRAALKHRAASVRHEAAIALADDSKLREQVLDVFVTSLRSKDWRLRWETCMALEQFDKSAKACVPGLLLCLLDKDPIVSRHAMRALVRIDRTNKEFSAALLRLLEQGPKKTRRREILRIFSCGGVPAAGAIPWLMRERDENNLGLREEATEALGRFSTTAATDARREKALNGVRSDDPAIRAESVRLLTGYGWNRHWPIILDRLRHDADEGVRIAAALSLGSSLDDEAVKVLVANLKSGGPSLRLAVMRAFRSTWRTALPAIPPLLRLIGDPKADSRLRFAARLTLRRVGGTSIVSTMGRTGNGLQVDLRRAEKVPDNCSKILDLVHGDHGDEIVRAWRRILVADPLDTLALALKQWDDSVPVRLCAVELIGSLAWDDNRALDLLTMTSAADPDEDVREAALGSWLVVWSRLHR